MTAQQLIELAKGKGCAISRSKPKHYQTHRIKGGKHVTEDFFGTWQSFVKHIVAK